MSAHPLSSSRAAQRHASNDSGLKTQVKQAHWNVKGMDFYQLHLLFDEMATELEEYIDLVAERVTALGGLAVGTARTARDSILPEFPFDILDGKEYVTALAYCDRALRPTPASRDRQSR